MAESPMEQTDADLAGTPGANAWLYLAVVFGFSWAAWLIALRLHAREEFLNFGAAGPALAAMLLSRQGKDRWASPARRAAVFVAMLFVCWIVLALRYGSNAGVGFHPNPWLMAVAVPPAWVLSGVFSKDGGIRSLISRLVHSSTRWSLIALLFFPAFLLTPAAIAKLLHLSLVTPQHNGPATTLIQSAVTLFLYNLLFVAVLEEPGWRGFLLDNVQQTRSPLVASIAVWAPWALWHLPLDYSRPAPFSLMMFLQVRVIFLIPIAIIMTWLYNRSRSSLQSTTMFHAGMNTFPFVLPYFPPALSLLFVVAGYAIYSDRMWRKKELEPKLSVVARVATGWRT